MYTGHFMRENFKVELSTREQEEANTFMDIFKLEIQTADLSMGSALKTIISELKFES